jgi:hypothetical protein
VKKRLISKGTVNFRITDALTKKSRIVQTKTEEYELLFPVLSQKTKKQKRKKGR